MAVTNTDDSTKSAAVDDSKEVTEEDLKQDKLNAEVETAKAADETAKDETATEESNEAKDEETEATDTTGANDDSSEFVKEFSNIKGDTLEAYARGLEVAYKNSTAEAIRLKGLADATPTPVASENTDESSEPADLSDPLQLWAKQNLDEQIQEAYTEFRTKYSQVDDPAEYNRFTTTVSELTNTIRQSQNRLAKPAELYSKAAVILGWEAGDAVDGKDRLGNALKDRASISKTSSATKSTPRSKVTDEMIAVNKLMYPNKSESEIRKELEPYVK